MIDESVKFIVGQLNQSLKAQYDVSEDMVIISNLSDKSAVFTNNHLVAMLVNIERDTYPQHSIGNKHYNVLNGKRPVFLNLYLMFIATHEGEKYIEALRFISSTIEFFQDNPVFERSAYAEVPSSIEKMILDIENLNLRELHNIWTLVTGRYMPSVLYRVRTIPFDNGMTRPVTTIKETDSRVIK
ncbi:DUF4255 domain-containing protein [Spartinivicinus poritis]|uniref:DUF4255 domain-containing protein n=1 Tax=Spartinivicinus poritis TaxID=2994640 RepID=A0ABT5U5A5_9GAMM|nr:DUF4255 domain-containing protein [Spartinivicinus sp. A2-2]MDE1460663.1 DUF4255 domain-containing protein [Spartinivicinus sp. A2-2]